MEGTESVHCALPRRLLKKITGRVRDKSMENTDDKKTGQEEGTHRDGCSIDALAHHGTHRQR